jgi:hypothetical protein
MPLTDCMHSYGRGGNGGKNGLYSSSSWAMTQAASDRELDGLKSQIAIMEAAVADAEERVDSAQRRARADARAAIAKSKASASETLEVLTLCLTLSCS